MAGRFYHFPSGLVAPRKPGPWQNSCPGAATMHRPDPADMDPRTGISPTMKQVKCPKCGLYFRWVPRAKAKPKPTKGG
jgi:hypothetical protein